MPRNICEKREATCESTRPCRRITRNGLGGAQKDVRRCFWARPLAFSVEGGHRAKVAPQLWLRQSSLRPAAVVEPSKGVLTITNAASWLYRIRPIENAHRPYKKINIINSFFLLVSYLGWGTRVLKCDQRGHDLFILP
jgi:hypothetical protein